MIFIVTLAFIAIIASLGLAMYYMLKGGKGGKGGKIPANSMSKALALRVILSIALFLCILISWKLGLIEPTGIKPGQ
ncbi:MAG: twin transmembrane helix small protein [Betaproteobacteria bacterium]|jgi:hypothetical protein